MKTDDGLSSASLFLSPFLFSSQKQKMAGNAKIFRDSAGLPATRLDLTLYVIRPVFVADSRTASTTPGPLALLSECLSLSTGLSALPLE